MDGARVEEGAEHEYGELINDYDPPSDWNDPKWNEFRRVHNWRNYATDGLISEWNNFTNRQKIIISSLLKEMARSENWE